MFTAQRPVPQYYAAGTGMEGAGVIEAVGEGVTHLQVTAPLTPPTRRAATAMCVTPVMNVLPPDGIDFETGAGHDAHGSDRAVPVEENVLPVEGPQRAISCCSRRGRWRGSFVSGAKAPARGDRQRRFDEKCALPASTALSSPSPKRRLRRKKNRRQVCTKVVYDLWQDIFDKSLGLPGAVWPDGELWQRQRPSGGSAPGILGPGLLGV
jgi:NADPH2:quinone reductase